ncbi:molecular chaperone DnaJ [Nocardiopsis alborubida]|uniref:Molecular chaperone DnaJ n=1 Tax=Nocardiopsis alborubida TaxID=146802 RepID=A0A7X6MF53_9ACTN|nr:molecular chaperone DnaJ [Nocardiopsis alborubida]NKZ00132.1 molecular chaperone DnaJ [Nocardiopsis alborubida]
MANTKYETCIICNGTGRVVVEKLGILGGRRYGTCGKCDGSGKTVVYRP